MKSIILACLAIMACMSMIVSDHVAVQHHHHNVRTKRGLSDFFKRFWNIRKKITYFPFQQQSSQSGPSSSSSGAYPSSAAQAQAAAAAAAAASFNPDYLLSQASNFYPIYQLNHGNPTFGQAGPIGANAAQFYLDQSNQIDFQPYQGPQIPAQAPAPASQPGSSYYYPQYPQHQLQQPPYSGTAGVNNNFLQQQQYPNGQQQQQQAHTLAQQVQPDESIQKPSYYYPNQVLGNQIGTSPYTFHSNPSQANTFHSKPYGNNPGTIDVHQVLDQFIRSAGLSPQGDHDNANRDRSYQDEKALSVKKLYSYPFYFSSSGDRPVRRQSIDEPQPPTVHMVSPSAIHSSSIKRISHQPVEPQPQPHPQPSAAASATSAQVLQQFHKQQQQLKQSVLKMEPMPMSNAVKIPQRDSSDNVAADESMFIAKNAAALQEFLANKQPTTTLDIASNNINEQQQQHKQQVDNNKIHA